MARLSRSTRKSSSSYNSSWTKIKMTGMSGCPFPSSPTVTGSMLPHAHPPSCSTMDWIPSLAWNLSENLGWRCWTTLPWGWKWPLKRLTPPSPGQQTIWLVLWHQLERGTPVHGWRQVMAQWEEHHNESPDEATRPQVPQPLPHWESHFKECLLAQATLVLQPVKIRDKTTDRLTDCLSLWKRAQINSKVATWQNV